tara:strand:+ start:40081 stop:40878 length:798 start_codon:yes stop_codon:yes gene_type:complete
VKYIALTIAGSDSSGGAGIQADLKTFSALGVYGTSAITALTAQNTVTVSGVHPAPSKFIALQIETTLDDIPAGAVKTGMLYNTEIIKTVGDTLEKRNQNNIVVDPVMIAKSGDELLNGEAVPVLRSFLLPISTVVTPNLPEAERLTGITIKTLEDMKEAALKIIKMGALSVVIKGGHMSGSKLVDVLLHKDKFTFFKRDRINTTHTHGTGCTFSAAIAAGLAKGLSIPDAVKEAEEYIEGCIRASTSLGHGHGPVNHFFKHWPLG